VDLNRDWAQSYAPQVLALLARCPAGCFLTFEPARLHDDLRNAIDYEPELIPRCTVLTRVRHTDHRDLTFRSDYWSASKGELAKVREGFGRYCGYFWVREKTGPIVAWMLVDLDLLRQRTDHLDHPKLIPHGDSNMAVVASVTQLRRAGCLAVDYAGPDPSDDPF
jgi:hypothetical protein